MANSILRRIIASAADSMAQRMNIPTENRAAFHDTFVSVFENQVVEILGGDTVQLTGWQLAPSARAARRRRILDALRGGESDGAIAARERVSRSLVQSLRARNLPLSPP